MPYGFASRSLSGMQALIAPGGADPSNQNILGHFDEARPDLQDGESALYNAFGQMVRVEQGKIKIGSSGSTDPVVLGNELKSLLEQLLNLIAIHTHPGPGAPPSNAADFTALENNIGVILSKIAFTE
jgi:hypothetical protein